MATFADYSGADYDIRMTVGDTFSEDIVLEDGDGDAIDLVGYSFASQLRRTADGPLVATFSVSTNVATSTVSRTLSSSVTANLDGVYVHDLQWTDPQGRVKTLFSGSFEMVDEVTR